MKKIVSIILLTLFFIFSAYSSRTVRIGWYNAPGLQSGETIDTLNGYNYEYLKKIQSFTDWKYEFVFATWKECEQMLIDGKIDIIGDVAITSDRLNKYNFCDTPNGESSMFMIKLAKNDSLAFADFKSFDGINIATIYSEYRESLITELAEANNFSFNLKIYPEHSDLFKAMNDGECDAALISNVNEYPVKDYQIIYKSKPNPFYFIVNKDQKAILKDLNSAMAQISIIDSNYNSKLFERYFGKFTKDLNISYTRNDYDYIATSPTVSALTPDNLPPYSYKNPDTGEMEGIIIDYYKLITKKTGIKFVYVINNNNTRENQLGKGIANIGVVQDNFQMALANNIKITQPFIVFQKGLVRKINDEKTIKNLGVLEYAIVPEEFYHKYNLTYYKSEIDVAKAILKDEVDAGYMNALEFDRMIEYLHNSNLKINIVDELNMNFGVSNISDPRLFSVLDKTVGNITNEEKLKINEDNTLLSVEMTPFEFIESHIVFVAFFLFINIILLILVIILRRINKLKMNHNKELKVALKRAKESDESKSLFLLSMSHDLRTPMNSIIGYSDLALSNLGDNENVKSSLLEIKSSSIMLSNILEELLYMSTIEQDEIYLKREEFNLKNTFDKIIDMNIEKTNLKNIKLSKTLNLKNYNVIGDENRLIKVINNIVKNSIDYTNEGSISIVVDEKNISEAKSIYKIVIKDTGIGMTKDQQARVFDKFYTAKGSKSYKTGGLGIGLNISKGILDKMNASISLESTCNEGTIIVIKIPYDLKKIKVGYNSSDLKKYNFSSKKILLVEDMDINIMLLMKLLSQTKINIVVAKNGKEAFDLFQKDNNFDIIFMDLQMPIMDGYESSKLIRSIGTDKAKNVPIIAVSANAFEEDSAKINASGINENFQKPINVERLVSILDKYLVDHI